MTTFKRVLFGFIGVYIFVALSLAHAQSDGATSASGHFGKHIQEIYSQLGLTDDQKKQLDANKQQHRTIMESARQQIKTDKETLKEELMKPQLDMPKIHQIHDQIKALQNQMEDVKLNSILAVRTILTPEQFLEFVNLMHKNKQGHE